MYKLLFVALIAITSFGFTSCNVLGGASSKSSVSSSTLGKIGTVLMQDLGTSVLSKYGAGDMVGKLSMATKLSSVLKSPAMVNTFKSMLSNKYGIATTKVNDSYDKMGNLKDVATFIGKNASQSFLSKL